MANLNGFWGAAYARAGRIGEARKLLEKLHRDARKQYVPPRNFALVYFALGEIDQCFDWLEKAVDEQDTWVFLIIAGTAWDSLHSHPRWNPLLRKMNLNP